MQPIDWTNLYKIIIRNFDKSMHKHEVAKLLMVMKLVHRHNEKKGNLRVYTERPITCNGKTRIADVYFENIATREVYVYEVQKNFSKSWLEETTEFYDSWITSPGSLMYKSIDWFPIDLNKLSTDIVKMSEQLEEFIF